MSKLTWEWSQLCCERESDQQILPPLCSWSWAGRGPVRRRLCEMAGAAGRGFSVSKKWRGQSCQAFQTSWFLPRRKGELWWNSNCFDLHNFEGCWDPLCVGRWLGLAIYECRQQAGEPVAAAVRWYMLSTREKGPLSVGALGFSTLAFPSSAWQRGCRMLIGTDTVGSVCSLKIANYVC